MFLLRLSGKQCISTTSCSRSEEQLKTKSWATRWAMSKSSVVQQLSTKANRSSECHLRRSHLLQTKCAWFTIGVCSHCKRADCWGMEKTFGLNGWPVLSIPQKTACSPALLRISVVNSSITSYLWTLSKTTPVVQWWSQQRLYAATSSLWPTINIQQEQSVY